MGSRSFQLAFRSRATERGIKESDKQAKGFIPSDKGYSKTRIKIIEFGLILLKLSCLEIAKFTVYN